jgi:hypothetical protein
MFLNGIDFIYMEYVMTYITFYLIYKMYIILYVSITVKLKHIVDTVKSHEIM